MIIYCSRCSGSEGGFNGSPTIAPYGGTKAWIHTFMKGVAIEQAKYGVRANCVCSVPIDTAWTHAETGPMEKKFEKNLIEATPLARRGTPEEVAKVIATRSDRILCLMADIVVRYYSKAA